MAPGEPLATSGSIVVVGTDGSLSLVDAQRHSTLLAPADGGSLAFPAWSPDGSRIAAIRAGQVGNAVVVFDPVGASAAAADEPVVVFDSAAAQPFYLSWTPDSRTVSFLASEPDGLSLRLAPADGSAPLDGTGPGSSIGSGSPFYYDWISPDRLLAHIGTGPQALLGEMGLDGAAPAQGLGTPGDFRSAVVSRDQAWVGYVRAGNGFAAEVVVAKRDGSSEHVMPLFGLAAVGFDPTGSVVASIGFPEPTLSSLPFPVGPLRLLDAVSGDVRTLLDGTNFGFWWSPDGKTIATLRIQPVAGSTATHQRGPFTERPASGGSTHLRRRRLRRHRIAIRRGAKPALHRPASAVLRPVRPEPRAVGAGQLVDPHAGFRRRRCIARRGDVSERRRAGPDRGGHRLLEPLGPLLTS